MYDLDNLHLEKLKKGYLINMIEGLRKDVEDIEKKLAEAQELDDINKIKKLLEETSHIKDRHMAS
jgi:hypothetical protein